MIENQLKETVERMCALPAVKNALTVLKEQLPQGLYYHNAFHTDDVLSEALHFALVDGLAHRELELLAIAAACHDVGFIKSPVKNEPLGAAFARAEMSKAGGYSEEEISLVEQMILDTSLVESDGASRQIPSTKLSRYLLDADLSNFGRDDFFEKGELLQRELAMDQEAFQRNTLALLSAHTWLTDAAMSLRQSKKEQNLTRLKALVSAHVTS